MAGKYWYTDANGKRHMTPAGVKHQHEKFPESKAKHAARVAARRAAVKAGKVKTGDSHDIDHIRGVSAGNGKGNLRVMSASANRGRHQGARKRGSKRNRAQWGK